MRFISDMFSLFFQQNELHASLEKHAGRQAVVAVCSPCSAVETLLDGWKEQSESKSKELKLILPCG